MGLLGEAILIIVALGGLELTLWLLGHRETKKQTELLAEIAISLAGCDILEVPDATEKKVEEVIPN
jgi:hypothetical protein